MIKTIGGFFFMVKFERYYFVKCSLIWEDKYFRLIGINNFCNAYPTRQIFIF